MSDRPGRWHKRFDSGIDSTFEAEIDAAKLVDAEWQTHSGPLGADRSGYVNVVFDKLPGWLEPVWASDEKWLYLRRPEGTWKTPIPDRLQPAGPLFLVDRVPGQADSGRRTRLGRVSTVAECWMDGFAQPVDVGARDCMDAVASLDVDFLGTHLGQPKSDGDRLLALAGDDFQSPPDFKLAGDWLIANDRALDLSCAYHIGGIEPIAKAMEQGALWIRYQGIFVPTFDVQARLASAAPSRLRRSDGRS
jgi:hypothetical protein